ncbi:hypothetical protein [Streptomyces sp. KR80]|uniref:hypothetical protein n=1 Tax=Streptomyces sp. KR80 TaxID=3457426 RepID=UPI003FD2A348
MPTPYGSRGAMAFSADELRVLRRALAIALQPAPSPPGSDREGDVRELVRLAEAVDEAAREGGRLRAFLLADLARYRAALPGAAVGFLERLPEALDAGHVPCADDLAALRALCGAPLGEAEAERRRALLHRCEVLAERALRDRLAHRARTAAASPHPVRLVALPGGRCADEEPQPKPRKPGPSPEPKPKPKVQPKPKPEPDRGPPEPSEKPGRHVPTPAEVFPPRRRPSPPTPKGPESPEKMAAV